MSDYFQTEQGKKLISDLKERFEEIDRIHIDVVNHCKGILEDFWREKIPETIYFKYGEIKVTFEKDKLWQMYRTRTSDGQFYNNLYDELKKLGMSEEAFPIKENNLGELLALEDTIRYIRREIIDFIHGSCIMEDIPDFEYGFFLRKAAGKEVKIPTEAKDILDERFKKFGLDSFWETAEAFYTELDSYHFDYEKNEEKQTYEEWIKETRDKVIDIVSHNFPLSFREIREQLGFESNSEAANELEEILSNPPFTYEKHDSYLYMTLEQKEQLNKLREVK